MVQTCAAPGRRRATSASASAMSAPGTMAPRGPPNCPRSPQPRLIAMPGIAMASQRGIGFDGTKLSISFHQPAFVKHGVLDDGALVRGVDDVDLAVMALNGERIGVVQWADREVT